MLSCKICNIKYNSKIDLYQNEYIESCPLCQMSTKLKYTQQKIKQLSYDLNKYKICENCQSLNGDCDKDRNVCQKLQSELKTI